MINNTSIQKSKQCSGRKRVDRNIYQDLKTGRYLVVLYHGYADGEIKRSSEVFDDLNEARRKRDKHEYERKYYGKSSNNPQITVAKCIEQYIEEKPIQETTKNGYRLRLKRISNSPLGKKKLASVKKIDIIRYLDGLEKEGRLKNKTINGDRQLLHAVFNYAIVCEYVAVNLVSGIEKKEEEQFEAIALSREESLELIRIIDSCSDTRMKVIACLGILQGMRRGEIAGLKWEDIKEYQGVMRIWIERERVPTGGQLVEKKPKTVKSRRKIPLQDLTRKALEEYKEEQKRAGTLGEYILLSNKGTPIFPTEINNKLNKFLSREEFRHFRLHDMRHTCCTLLIENDTGYTVASKYLGHSSSRTTEAIYTHLRDNITDGTLAVFTDIFGGVESQQEKAVE